MEAGAPHQLMVTYLPISEPRHIDHEVTVISEATSDRKYLMQDCFKVRIEVFHNEQGFPLETEIDEYVLSAGFPALFC